MLLKNKTLVIPGDIIADSLDYVPGQNTYRQDKKIISQRLGLVSIEGRVIKVIPLSGKYIPKKNDYVIAKVVDVTAKGWRLDINGPYFALLSLKEGTTKYVKREEDYTKIYNINDFLFVKLISVTSQMMIDASTEGIREKKLIGGRIIRINPYKIPRLIGKSGSMINLIKQKTKSEIIAGNNGLVFVKNQDPVIEKITADVIKLIERESHHSGLTEKVNDFLDQEIKKVKTNNNKQ